MHPRFDAQDDEGVNMHPRFDVQTPKALTNVSPGLFQPWVTKTKSEDNAESVGQRFQRLIERVASKPRVEATLG